MDNMGGSYVCEICRKGPLVGGDAMLSSLGSTEAPDDTDFNGIGRKILRRLSSHFIPAILAQKTLSSGIDFSSLTSQSSGSINLTQSQPSLNIQTQFSGMEEDLFSTQNLELIGMSSPASASITTVSTSPGDQHDITPSDNEEYKPTK